MNPADHIDGLLREPILPARRREALTGVSWRAINLALPRPDRQYLVDALTRAYAYLGFWRATPA